MSTEQNGDDLVLSSEERAIVQSCIDETDSRHFAQSLFDLVQLVRTNAEGLGRFLLENPTLAIGLSRRLTPSAEEQEQAHLSATAALYQLHHLSLISLLLDLTGNGRADVNEVSRRLIWFRGHVNNGVSVTAMARARIPFLEVLQDRDDLEQASALINLVARARSNGDPSLLEAAGRDVSPTPYGLAIFLVVAPPERALPFIRIVNEMRRNGTGGAIADLVDNSHELRDVFKLFNNGDMSPEQARIRSGITRLVLNAGGTIQQVAVLSGWHSIEAFIEPLVFFLDFPNTETVLGDAALAFAYRGEEVAAQLINDPPQAILFVQRVEALENSVVDNPHAALLLDAVRSTPELQMVVDSLRGVTDSREAELLLEQHAQPLARPFVPLLATQRLSVAIDELAYLERTDGDLDPTLARIADLVQAVGPRGAPQLLQDPAKITHFMHLVNDLRRAGVPEAIAVWGAFQADPSLRAIVRLSLFGGKSGNEAARTGRFKDVNQRLTEGQSLVNATRAVIESAPVADETLTPLRDFIFSSAGFGYQTRLILDTLQAPDMAKRLLRHPEIAWRFINRVDELNRAGDPGVAAIWGVIRSDEALSSIARVASLSPSRHSVEDRFSRINRNISSGMPIDEALRVAVARAVNSQRDIAAQRAAREHSIAAERAAAERVAIRARLAVEQSLPILLSTGERSAVDAAREIAFHDWLSSRRISDLIAILDQAPYTFFKVLTQTGYLVSERMARAVNSAELRLVDPDAVERFHAALQAAPPVLGAVFGIATSEYKDVRRAGLKILAKGVVEGKSAAAIEEVAHLTEADARIASGFGSHEAISSAVVVHAIQKLSAGDLATPLTQKELAPFAAALRHNMQNVFAVLVESPEQASAVLDHLARPPAPDAAGTHRQRMLADLKTLTEDPFGRRVSAEEFVGRIRTLHTSDDLVEAARQLRATRGFGDDDPGDPGTAGLPPGTPDTPGSDPNKGALRVPAADPDPAAPRQTAPVPPVDPSSDGTTKTLTTTALADPTPKVVPITPTLSSPVVLIPQPVALTSAPSIVDTTVQTAVPQPPIPSITAPPSVVDRPRGAAEVAAQPAPVQVSTPTAVRSDTEVAVMPVPVSLTSHAGTIAADRSGPPVVPFWQPARPIAQAPRSAAEAASSGVPKGVVAEITHARMAAPSVVASMDVREKVNKAPQGQTPPLATTPTVLGKPLDDLSLQASRMSVEPPAAVEIADSDKMSGDMPDGVREGQRALPSGGREVMSL